MSLQLKSSQKWFWPLIIRKKVLSGFVLFTSLQLNPIKKLFLTMITRTLFLSSWDPFWAFNYILFNNDFVHWSQEKSFSSVESLYDSSTRSSKKKVSLVLTDHKETAFLQYFWSMMFQMTNLRECLWMLITRRWFLSSMGSFMHLQITSLRKSIWTKNHHYGF